MIPNSNASSCCNAVVRRLGVSDQVSLRKAIVEAQSKPGFGIHAGLKMQAVFEKAYVRAIEKRVADVGIEAGNIRLLAKRRRRRKQQGKGKQNENRNRSAGSRSDRICGEKAWFSPGLNLLASGRFSCIRPARNESRFDIIELGLKAI